MNSQLTKDSLYDVIHRWTGVSKDVLLAAEIGPEELVESLKKNLYAQIVGQDGPIGDICSLLETRLPMAQIEQLKRPIGVLYLVGSSGVGKTLAGKIIAETLTDGELTQIDLGQITEAHQVTTLIGSPPSYIGYESGGLLTKDLLKRPYRTLLFDEADKTHPVITEKVLLPLLGEGFIQSGDGKIIDASRTIVIFTSNLGNFANLDDNNSVIGFGKINNNEDRNEKTKGAIENQIPPTLRGRIDTFVIFNQIDEDGAWEIASRSLSKLSIQLMRGNQKNIYRENIGDEQGVQIYLEEPVQKWIRKELGKTVLSEGARGVKKVVDKYLVEPIVSIWVKEGINHGNKSKIAVSMQDGEFIYEIVPANTGQLERKNND